MLGHQLVCDADLDVVRARVEGTHDEAIIGRDAGVSNAGRQRFGGSLKMMWRPRNERALKAPILGNLGAGTGIEPV
jgi:hypothetical protein